MRRLSPSSFSSLFLDTSKPLSSSLRLTLRVFSALRETYSACLGLEPVSHRLRSYICWPWTKTFKKPCCPGGPWAPPTSPSCPRSFLSYGRGTFEAEEVGGHVSGILSILRLHYIIGYNRLYIIPLLLWKSWRTTSLPASPGPTLATGTSALPTNT